MSNEEKCSTPKITTPMINKIQKHAMPLYDEPSQSTRPKSVVQTRLLTASITQTSEIENFEANSTRRFPEDPKNYNPVQLLNEMKPGVKFIETIISSKNSTVFQVKCVIDNFPFIGQALKKKAAKMECCIMVIKCFWKFDFHAEVDLYDHRYKLKSNSTRMFPEDPKNYNPVQLLNEMKPGVKFVETIISSKNSTVFQVKCVIDNIPFIGQGSKKKAAKMECCIMVIKCFWKFDFHAEVDLYDDRYKLKANSTRMFPEDPKNYNPVQLLNEMKPGVKFIETIISSKNSTVFQVKCVIDNIPFVGQALKKKAAKMECCIMVIKCFWKFDFHAEVDLYDHRYKLKSNSTRMFPEDPKNYNPVQLLNEMKPGVKFIETIISSKNSTVFQVKCVIDNIPFIGQALKKKAAKMECCIMVIKCFWKFDFHAEVDLYDHRYKLKSNSTRMFPEDPKNYNPVQLLNEMKPGVKFVETIISSKNSTVFQVKCVIDNIPFIGQGSKKKAAKMECCIAVIKYFWQFDFHAEVDLPTKKLLYL